MKKIVSSLLAVTLLFGALSFTSPRKAHAVYDPVLFTASAVSAVGLVVLAVINYSNGDWAFGDLSINLAAITSITSDDLKKMVAGQLAEDAAAFIVNDGANATGLLAATMKKMREEIAAKAGANVADEATDVELAYGIIEASRL